MEAAKEERRQNTPREAVQWSEIVSSFVQIIMAEAQQPVDANKVTNLNALLEQESVDIERIRSLVGRAQISEEIRATVIKMIEDYEAEIGQQA